MALANRSISSAIFRLRSFARSVLRNRALACLYTLRTANLFRKDWVLLHRAGEEGTRATSNRPFQKHEAMRLIICRPDMQRLPVFRAETVEHI
jgi:hypothetical protein